MGLGLITSCVEKKSVRGSERIRSKAENTKMDPTTAYGNKKPPYSYNIEPRDGPKMYPKERHISVYDINVAAFSGNILSKIAREDPQTAASAIPLKNLSKYDNPKKIAVLETNCKRPNNIAITP